MKFCQKMQLAALIATCFGASSVSAQGRAQWSVAPYLRASETAVDLTFRDTNVGAGDISFRGLLDVIDAPFMGHAERAQGEWGVFTDVTCLSTSDTTDRTLVTIDAENKQLFIDAAVTFRPHGVDVPFSIFGGMRYTGFDDLYRFSAAGSEPGTQRSRADYSDALIGARCRLDLAEKWAIVTRGDVSFGDSEGTILLRANVPYAVGRERQNSVLLAYQWKDAEYRDGDLTTDFKYSGPTAGSSFRI